MKGQSPSIIGGNFEYVRFTRISLELTALKPKISQFNLSSQLGDLRSNWIQGNLPDDKNLSWVAFVVEINKYACTTSFSSERVYVWLGIKRVLLNSLRFGSKNQSL